jgi:hypothetical protein
MRQVRFKFRCNILISGKIIKEMPGSVASGTPCITNHKELFSTLIRVPDSGRPVPEMTGQEELGQGEDSSQCSDSVLASVTLSVHKVAYRYAEQL